MKTGVNAQSRAGKCILALDGGGIRGTITLGFLEKVESMLRSQHGQPNLVLADYFDLIIGTSTGAIIAGALSIGMPVVDIVESYLKLGGKVFKKKNWKDKLNPATWLKAEFDAGMLDEELKSVFGDITLGSQDIKTGICVVTKRADTGSTWVNINHPNDRFFEQKRGILLRKLIRASTAAPTYFEPEILDVGGGERGSFIDGGVSTANNPSLLALLLVTLKGFPYQWTTGADLLYMLSVGTGCWHDRFDHKFAQDQRHLFWARTVPGMLMNDVNTQNQLLLQSVSNSLNPVQIDQQVGTATGELAGANPLLTYVRYDAQLETNYLNFIGRTDLASQTKLDSLRDMSAAVNRDDLLDIGRRAADKQVALNHFPKTFCVLQSSWGQSL